MGRVQGPPSTPSMDKGSLSRAPGWTTSFDTDIDIDAGPSFRLKAGVRWRVGSLTFSHSSLRRKLKWKLKSEVHCNTAWRLVEGSPSKSSSSGDSRLLHSCFISSKHLVIESYNIISETYLKHVAAIRLSKETFRDIGTSRAWKGQRLPWDDPPRWTDQETPRHRPSLSSGSLDVGPWTFELRMARNNWRDVNLAASTLILKHSHYDHIMITLWSHYDHIMITLCVWPWTPKSETEHSVYKFCFRIPKFEICQHIPYIPTLARLPQSVHHLERPYAIHVSTNFVVPPALQTWRDGEIWTSGKMYGPRSWFWAGHETWWNEVYHRKESWWETLASPAKLRRTNTFALERLTKCCGCRGF